MLFILYIVVVLHVLYIVYSCSPPCALYCIVVVSTYAEVYVSVCKC